MMISLNVDIIFDIFLLITMIMMMTKIPLVSAVLKMSRSSKLVCVLLCCHAQLG